LSTLVLRGADLGDLGPGRPVDVRVVGGVVTQVGAVDGGGESIDCAGGAVLPGLHDHHVHLLATAAAADSVACDMRDKAGLAAALRGATPAGGWIRGVGYDDGAIGPLDRDALDELRADVPVRVQHRGGSLWVLNGAGLAAVRIDEVDLDGVERDVTGRPTGRLWRLDGWLADRLGSSAVPDLAAMSTRLASYGITGVTDATPELPTRTARLLTGGALVQRVTLLGDRESAAPWKIVLSDHRLPDLDELRSRIAAARPRAVALHCVTRVALILALTALREVGVRHADRIEHAAVCPRDVATQLAALGIAVVTQPSLVALRGDDYLDRAEQEDVAALWPLASLLDAGVAVGCSSDAPYGDLDPWRTIAAAAYRVALSGRLVGPAERVPAGVALARFLTPADDPGGPPRHVSAGAVADLVVLDRPLVDALREPADVRVRHTLIAGRVVYAAETMPA
jgi:predicted amidohydrolase YtcJ